MSFWKLMIALRDTDVCYVTMQVCYVTCHVKHNNLIEKGALKRSARAPWTSCTTNQLLADMQTQPQHAQAGFHYW
jgi:hypothetical protein